MSLFTSGDNGTFDSTIDPNGNPPSDWNITKAADSIIKFNNVNPITGTGSMHCESRTIFNNDYALMTFDSTSPVDQGEGYVCEINDVSNLDFNNNFILELRYYISETGTGSAAGIKPILIKSATGNINIYLENNYVVLQFITASGTTTLQSLAGTSALNEWRHVVISYENGVAMKLYVNGSKTIKTTNFTPVGLNPPDTVQFYGRGDVNSKFFQGNYVRGVRIYQGITVNDTQAAELYGGNGKVIQPVPVALQSFLTNEYLLNQEQGQAVYNNETETNDAELNVGETNSYSLSQLQFGGGAWVDVSLIG